MIPQRSRGGVFSIGNSYVHARVSEAQANKSRKVNREAIYFFYNIKWSVCDKLLMKTGLKSDINISYVLQEVKLCRLVYVMTGKKSGR